MRYSERTFTTLSSVSSYAKEHVKTENLTLDNYISTENMLQEKAGVTIASGLPTTAQTLTFQAGDVLVSNIRPYFKKIWQADKMGGCSNDVLVFRARENYNPKFLYYVLSDSKFFEYSMSTSKGTKMPRGDKSALMNYAVPSLPISEQKVIAATLSCFDDKIGLNNKINDNLEQQVQALFRSWFVDSQHGSIPNTWALVPLEQLCTVITKGTTPTTLRKSFVQKGINFIKAESIMDNHSIDTNKFAFIDDETNIMLKRSIIQNGDIVFTIAGTLGRFALIDESIIPANTNQAVAIIRPDMEKITSEYLYSFFIGNWHKDYYSKRIQQAVQANLSLTTIKSLPIAILPNNEMSAYIDIITPLFKMIKSNVKENRRLVELRDALLPKLMSGEFCVQNLDI